MSPILKMLYQRKTPPSLVVNAVYNTIVAEGFGRVTEGNLVGLVFGDQTLNMSLISLSLSFFPTSAAVAQHHVEENATETDSRAAVGILPHGVSLVVKAEKVIRFNVLPLRRVQHVQTRLTM